jgi:hypothetical protein
MAVLFPLLHAVQKISERATFGNSAILACRNLRLTWFLIRWKCNFMGLLISKDILLFSLEVVQKLMGTDTSCELIRCWRPWSCGLRGVTSRLLCH